VVSKKLVEVWPEEAHNVINAFGKLDSAGFDIGIVKQGDDVVAVLSDSQIQRIVSNLKNVSDGSVNPLVLGNIKGASAEVISASEKHFTELVKLNGTSLTEIGDLTLSGNRFVEVKSKDLTGIAPQDILNDAKVLDYVNQIVKDLKKAPTPQNGTHYFEFYKIDNQQISVVESAIASKMEISVMQLRNILTVGSLR
jgi:hypothetical protein